jgi:AcrR family transcriptional regulator
MNRDLILEAAANIFSQKGFHAASMRDIAEAVSLQKGSLYHHVSSKEEILVEILDKAIDLLTDRMEEVTSQTIPPIEKFRLAVRSYIQTMTGYRGPASVLLLEYRSLSPELQRRHIPRRDRYEELWRELLLEGQQAGVFHLDDLAMASRAMLGAMSWTVTWYRPDGKLSADEIADRFSTLFLNGLLQRESNGAAGI